MNLRSSGSSVCKAPAYLSGLGSPTLQGTSLPRMVDDSQQGVIRLTECFEPNGSHEYPKQPFALNHE